MQKNMGNIDTTLSVSAAVVIAILYFTDIISGTAAAALVLLAVAGIFILTGFTGFCPLYIPFNISTRKVGKERH